MGALAGGSLGKRQERRGSQETLERDEFGIMESFVDPNQQRFLDALFGAGAGVAASQAWGWTP